MFKVTKLKITGFKSFAHPTEIEISDGVTGIVGPNGCGKSNIFESIRWVMGELSSKTLRSSSMDEIIFNGTETLPAKNYAEVSLELEKSKDNNDIKFFKDDDLVVSRSIERGVGSFYKMNNKEVRAKDVSVFFSDTGSGSRSSSIIGQGNIDQIINFKPIERKIILEDAAGISGLQARRRESELKLEATATNLARLDDILKNLDFQMRTLKRQSRQAEKYQQLTNNIKKNENLILFLEWKELDKKFNEVKNLFSDYRKKLDGLKIELDESQVIKEEKRKLIEEQKDLVFNFNTNLQKVLSEKNNLLNKKNFLDTRKKEITQFLENLEKDRNLEKNRLEEITSNIKEISENIDKFVDIKKLKINLKESQTEEFHLQEKLKASESNFVNEMQLLLGEEFKSDNLKESQEYLINKKNDLMGQKKYAQREINENNLKEFEEKIEILKDEKIVLENKLSLLKANNVKITKENQINSETLNSKNQEIIKFKEKLTEITTEIHTLKKLIEDNDIPKDSIFNLLKIKKGYENAVFSILKHELDAELSKSKKRWVNMEISNLESAENPLSQFVSFPKKILPFLSQVTYVNDNKSGYLKQKKLKTGQMVVSSDGTIWRWDGYVDEKKERNKIINYSSRIEKLKKDSKIYDKQLIVGLNEIKKLKLKCEQNKKDEFKYKSEIEKVYLEINKITNEISSINENNIDNKSNFEKLTEKISFINKEIILIDDELQKINDHQKIRDQHSKKNPRGEKSFTEKLILEIKDEINKKRFQISKLNEEIISSEIKYNYMYEDLKKNKKRKNEAEAQISNFNSREKIIENEKKKIQEFPMELEEKLSSLENKVKNFNVEIDAGNKQIEQQSDLLENIDKEIKKTESEIEQIKDRTIRSEENINHLKEKKDTLREIIFQKIRCQPEEMKKRLNIINEEEIQIDNTKSQLDKYVLQREQMGPVNLRAYIEEQDTKKEFDRIELERNDLYDAIEKLRLAISQINNEGKRKLFSAFEQVNENFTKLFKKLFNGGEASLELIKSEDPLQTGLEIFAKPPGKKLTNISLLSGGEKTLTAIALIFSIFLINPSPLCILDEVDAALDDANVDKFCEIMKFIRNETDTRFLIISHHKTTMAMVDRIYGVTMKQKGISDIVSVDFESNNFKTAV